MELAVGKDLYALCGKCGATYHVIVAKDGAKVSRVQCKQCMGYHRYRAPAGEVDVNRAAKPARRKVTRSAGKNGKTTRAAPRKTRRRADEPLVDPDLSRPVRTYAVSDTYEPGERIEHPKFGQGVVESSPAPGKVNVFFEDGRRTLVHGRERAATL